MILANLSRKELEFPKVVEVLSKKIAVRILSVVYKYDGLNISKICTYTGANHQIVTRYVEEICVVGVLEEKKFGKIRIINPAKQAVTIQFKKRKRPGLTVELKEKI